MQSENLLEEELDNICCRVPGGDGKEVGKISQPVDHYVYAILPLYCGEPCDEIH